MSKYWRIFPERLTDHFPKRNEMFFYNNFRFGSAILNTIIIIV